MARGKKVEHKFINGVEYKHCGKCQEYKPLSEFGKDLTRWDKLNKCCKACARGYSKKYYQNNKEYFEEYRQNNKEYYEEYSKKHYQNNKEYYEERRKGYYQNNHEAFKIRDNKRRAKKKALPANLTAKQWDKIMKDFNNSCALTGEKENIHQEHFIPLSIMHGGTTKENMYPMKGHLNISKHNKNPFEWIKEQPEEYQNNFYNNLVPYLAKKNKMQVKEYEDFVYWCFANPRTLEQAEKDNEEGLTSKNLFYQSINFMGGCRS